MSQKELAGQSELPGQGKGEDRKEHKEGASMSDRTIKYVENDEAGKPRSSGFSQSNSNVCRERGRFQRQEPSDAENGWER